MSVKIIAHRGANRKAPQNTLPAFRQAIADGADGFETDVHLTKDGVPVICHNYTIDKTSDGTGEISSYTLDELKQFDFGAYFSEGYRGTPLPTLDEFLDLVGPTDAEIINIELKCPKGRMFELVNKTMEAVRRHGVLDRVIISSFSPAILKIVKDIEPRCKTGFLHPTQSPSICRAVFVEPYTILKSTHADYAHPASITVTRLSVFLEHKMGRKVNVWTVNDEPTVRYLLACGVDGIITDVPDKVRAIVEKAEGRRAAPVPESV